MQLWDPLQTPVPPFWVVYASVPLAARELLGFGPICAVSDVPKDPESSTVSCQKGDSSAKLASAGPSSLTVSVLAGLLTDQTVCGIGCFAAFVLPLVIRRKSLLLMHG